MATTNQSVSALIGRARDTSADVAGRHEAFGELVRRFQDLAFACACARLRDPALAEDAAQDAFLTAWERLDQLREAAAFPGWIRRLVLTQCHRRLRGARLQLVPQDEAEHVAAAADPALDAGAAGDEALVHRALALLPPGDRLVLILFYGCERSQAEIADWLRVPVTTVSRRLAHAKRRMRDRTLDAFGGGLRAQRRIAGEAFIVELSARLRPAEPADADGIAQLATHLGLDRATRLAQAAPLCAYLVEDAASRAPIAWATALPTIFAPVYDLQIAVGEEALARHAGDVLLSQILPEVAATGAVTLQHRTPARQAAVVAFLCARGFEIVERDGDWRLDGAAPMAPPIDVVCTGIDALSREPALFDAALHLLTGAIAGDPSAAAFLPLHPDTLRRTLRLQRDGVVAIEGETLQGFIASSADDHLPHTARINIVVVRNDTRRRGLATLLLARLLQQIGTPRARIVAQANADLTGWLTRCGFVQAADRLMLERLLRKTVRIAPERLDDYVGRYVAAAMPQAPIVIERHGDRLVSKVRDMRDVLLAASESEFFTRHHFGRGRFERDETGRVVRLVSTEGPHQVIASRE